VRIPPLLVFPDEELGFGLWIAGGEHEASEGVDYLVAQGFLARKSYDAGELVVDEFGQAWRFTSDVTPGFALSGIVMKLEG
jgi:hypothetical protein